MPNKNSIHLKTKPLSRYHHSCHGNPVAVARKNAAHPKKCSCKYELNRTQDKRVIQVSL